MGINSLLNSQSAGTKLPRCGGTYALIPLFMGVYEEVIEHIADDAYSRQGELVELSDRSTVGKKKTVGERSKTKPTNGQ